MSTHKQRRLTANQEAKRASDEIFDSWERCMLGEIEEEEDNDDPDDDDGPVPLTRIYTRRNPYGLSWRERAWGYYGERE